MLLHFTEKGRLVLTFELHDPEALLNSLRELPRETGWVEFKENQFNHRTVASYVSGLANAAMLEGKETAFMVWGIADGSHDIVGTSIDIEAEKVGAESFLAWLQKMLSPRIIVDAKSFELDGKSIQMLCIIPGYIQPVAFESKEFIRIDSALKPLKDYPERARALWQVTSSYSFEKSVILTHASESDILEKFDIGKFLGLLNIRDRSNHNQMEYLEKIGLIKSNLQGGYEVYAQLALACARNMNDYPLTAHKGIRIIVYRGADKLDSLDDTEGKKGYVTSFQAMLNHILKAIPSGEVQSEGIRKRTYAIPEDAIREFLANALVHQDFTHRGSRPTVEIYSDRIKFQNPGAPLVDPDRFVDTPSTTRNENLANLMRQAGLCELRGSGVDRALREIERAILPPPLFAQVEGSTIVSVFMPKKFRDMTSSERVRACYQHAQLLHERNEAISNSTLRARFGLPPKQISQVSIVIRDALDAGRIKPLDPDQGNRNARYVPAYA